MMFFSPQNMMNIRYNPGAFPDKLPAINVRIYPAISRLFLTRTLREYRISSRVEHRIHPTG